MASSSSLWLCAPSSLPSCSLFSSSSLLVSSCCSPPPSPSLALLSCLRFGSRLLFFPFRSFFPVAPGGAGSARVPFFLAMNCVRLVLDGIVYGYVLLGVLHVSQIVGWFCRVDVGCGVALFLSSCFCHCSFACRCVPTSLRSLDSLPFVLCILRFVQC